MKRLLRSRKSQGNPLDRNPPRLISKEKKERFLRKFQI
jgi:hypothetical protein